jgi:hypothetical protein
MQYFHTIPFFRYNILHILFRIVKLLNVEMLFLFVHCLTIDKITDNEYFRN